MDKEKIRRAVRDILEAIGEDPEREGLRDTPKRVAEMYENIFSGIDKNPVTHLELFLEDEEYEDLVLIKDIKFYSMCEHHLIPFYGNAHVAYIPKKGKVTGFSRIVRVVETVASRPQLQERMTKIIADSINDALDPHGLLVLIEAEQMCMTMRGVKKPGIKTITSTVRGLFKKNAVVREETINLINRK